MARATRIVSKSDIYHVILRGVNKQRIFEQPEDYDAMKRILTYVQTQDSGKIPTAEPNFFLYAYCLMDNHIHLLIQPNSRELGWIMKRIMATYAIYFNNTYERLGHLYQDRYKSEPVEDSDYFFTLLEYIHMNPVKKGLCERPSQYPYSSYGEWEKVSITEKQDKKGQSLNVSFFSEGALCCLPQIWSRLEMEEEYHRHAEAMFAWKENPKGDRPKRKSMNLLAISPEQIQDAVLLMNGAQQQEEPTIKGLFARVKQLLFGSEDVLCKKIRAQLDWQTAEEKDRAIVAMILEMTGAATISEFQRMDKPTVRTALAIVRDSGVGDGRLSRLTGISRGIIQRSQIYPKKNAQMTEMEQKQYK